MIKQQLQGKKKNIPTNASQVCSSITSTLNESKDTVCRRDTLTCNNPDVNQDQHTGRSLKALVYVVDSEGTKLMPCSFAKAKRLVKKGAAKLIKCYPFKVIQLNFKAAGVQETILGIDSGYQNIGFSAVSSKKELISGTLVLDDKTKKRLVERKMYRRGRRNRHHWYRQARFDNRKKNNTWMLPSVERRYKAHLSIINKIKSLLPISNTIIETANFDIQKIQNPNISGKEYQQGQQLGFENIKQYVLTRDKRTCQHCGKTETRLEVHHIKFRSQGGTDNPSNLITLCSKCHKDLHSNKIFINKAIKEYKPNIFMSFIKNVFKKDIPNMKETFGYITKQIRLKLGLKKTHYNDAFCIAGGNEQERILPIELKQKHRNNRAIQLNRKGFKPSIRKQRYKIQPGDLVKVNKKWYITKGMASKGTQCLINKQLIGSKKIEQFFNLKWAISI